MFQNRVIPSRSFFNPLFMRYILIPLASIICFLLSSCNDEKTVLPSEIHVKNTSDKSQFGVRVNIYKMESGLTLINTGKTNSNGVYSYPFDAPGNFKVVATRFDTALFYDDPMLKIDSVCGEKEFSLIENSRIECSVVLRDCD